MDILLEQLQELINQYRNDARVTQEMMGWDDGELQQKMLMLADAQLICADELEVIVLEHLSDEEG